MDKHIQAIKAFDETVQRLEEGFVSHAQFVELARKNARHIAIIAAAVAAAVSVVVSVLAAIFRS